MTDEQFNALTRRLDGIDHRLDEQFAALSQKIDPVDGKLDRLIKHLGADIEQENLSRVERHVTGTADTQQPMAAKSP